MFILHTAEYSVLPPSVVRSLGELTSLLVAYGVRLQLVLPGGRTVPLRSSSPSTFPTNISVELTAAEWRIAVMVASGSTNREIAEARRLSPKTIEAHLTHIYRKLGLRSRAELAVRVIEATRTNRGMHGGVDA